MRRNKNNEWIISEYNETVGWELLADQQQVDNESDYIWVTATNKTSKEKRKVLVHITVLPVHAMELYHKNR